MKYLCERTAIGQPTKQDQDQLDACISLMVGRLLENELAAGVVPKTALVPNLVPSAEARSVAIRNGSRVR